MAIFIPTEKYALIDVWFILTVIKLRRYKQYILTVIKFLSYKLPIAMEYNRYYKRALVYGNGLVVYALSYYYASIVSV